MVPHNTYVDPFGGGGSALLAHSKHANNVETRVYNDLMYELVMLFSSLSSKKKYHKLMEQLALSPNARKMYLDLRDQYKVGRSISGTRSEVARDILVLTRQSFSGLFLTGWSRLVREIPRNKWHDVVYAISEFGKILSVKGLVCENDDALKIMKKYDSPETMHYLDPPYVHDTRINEDAYAFEMTNKQHVKFCKTCLQMEGMCIVSGYQHPIYEMYFGNWQRVDIELACTVTLTYDKGKKSRRVESIWLSPNLSSKLRRGTSKVRRNE